jgi:hypothetical protein
MLVKARSTAFAMEMHAPNADRNAEIAKDKFATARTSHRTEAKPEVTKKQ